MTTLADILTKSAVTALALMIPAAGAAWFILAFFEAFHLPRPRWPR